MVAESDLMEQKWSVHTSNQILYILNNGELTEQHMKEADLRVFLRSLKSQKAIEIPPGMKRKGYRGTLLSSVYGDGSKSHRGTIILLPKDMAAKNIVPRNPKKKRTQHCTCNFIVTIKIKEVMGHACCSQLYISYMDWCYRLMLQNRNAQQSLSTGLQSLKVTKTASPCSHSFTLTTCMLTVDNT